MSVNCIDLEHSRKCDCCFADVIVRTVTVDYVFYVMCVCGNYVYFNSKGV